MMAALTPPEPVLEDLARAVDRTAAMTGKVPWTPQHTWRIRLCLLGNLGLAESLVVSRAMAELASYGEPLNLSLAGSRVHPKDMQPRAEHLAVGISGDVDDLKTLANAVPTFLKNERLFLDRRAFQPEVIIAHAAREPFDARAGAAALAGYAGPTWQATGLEVLRFVKGVDASSGVRYEEAQRHPFTATPEPT